MSQRRPLVVGTVGPFHELAACVFRGNTLLAYGEEERWNRKKKSKYPEPTNADQLPEQALRWCLETAGVRGADIDLIGYPYDPTVPVLLPGDEVTADGWGSPAGEAAFQACLRRVPALLSDLLGADVTDRVHMIKHHLAHAASAYYTSPYTNAAVLSVDGRGESTTTWMGHGRGLTLEPLAEIHYPHSIGFFWEAMSQFLGLDQFAGPGQLMGLAAWGNPDRYAAELSKVLIEEPDGFRIDNSYTQFRLLERGGPADRLEGLFGPRYPARAELDRRAADIAAALQAATERVLLNLAVRLRERTGATALCVAGGVALNAVAMSRILHEGGYDDLYVQPAASDAGCALGSALWLAHNQAEVTDRWVMTHPFIGPEFSDAEILAAIEAAGLVATRPDDLTGHVARLLADGQIVGWFQGKAAAGPRALGCRSLLGDPRDPLMMTRLNFTKHRAGWRPVAGSVLAEHAHQWIDMGGARSPSHATMNLTHRVHADRRHLIPAVVAADGTTRAQVVTAEQNGRYHELISRVHRLTRVPWVVNTSLNDPGEPIVGSPADALALFQRAAGGIDAMALGDYLVRYGDDGGTR
jgi:carbamoyltransferase